LVVICDAYSHSRRKYLEGKKIYENGSLEPTDDVLILRLRDHQASILPEEEQATEDQPVGTSLGFGARRHH
jgi:hypothetical protein